MPEGKRKMKENEKIKYEDLNHYRKNCIDEIESLYHEISNIEGIIDRLKKDLTYVKSQGYEEDAYNLRMDIQHLKDMKDYFKKETIYFKDMKNKLEIDIKKMQSKK